jgi:hypothetical protein
VLQRFAIDYLCVVFVRDGVKRQLRHMLRDGQEGRIKQVSRWGTYTVDVSCV